MGDIHEGLDRRRAMTRLASALGLPGGFAGMSGSSRLRAIMDLRDPGRLIRSLRPDELYFLLKSIGLEDSQELLAYATPEQRRGLCDLDVWSGAGFSPERLDGILDLAAGVSRDVALSFLREADLEVLALRLFGSCRITPVAEADEDADPDHAFRTPDGMFVVVAADPEQVPALRRFLDLLYALDVERALLVIFGGNRDTPSSLEDQAFRFREARLQDLGFPPEAERFAVWEPFDAAPLRARLRTPATGEPAGPVRDEKPLALAANALSSPPFFWRALARAAADGDVSGPVHLMMHLFNKVLAARTTDYFKEDAWEQAAAHAVSLMSLGLEDLSGADEETVARTLSRAWPVELYRCGLEVVRPAHLRARRVSSLVGGPARLGLFGDGTAEVLAALLAFPPQFCVRLLGKDTPARRDFGSVAEVGLANRAVFQAEAVLGFATDRLGFRPQDREGRTGLLADVTFANVLATAWARQVMEGDASLRPMSGDDVRSLIVAAFDRGRLREGVREAALDALCSDVDPGRREAIRGFVSLALDRVESTLGGLDPSLPVDTRFVGDALLVSG